jgi:endonuclease YncB( thermonuclease family)
MAPLACEDSRVSTAGAKMGEVPTEFIGHPLPFIGGTWRAVVVGVHDADTVAASSTSVSTTTRFGRCASTGINAPELSTPAGKLAQVAVQKLALWQPCRVETPMGPKDKYGRFLARVVLVAGGSAGKAPALETDLAAWAVANGFAVAWDGTGAKPV